MRLSGKLVEGVISDVVGEDALPLVSILRRNKDVSELKLAKVLKRDINQVRNMLYRLHQSNLVYFTRKKDEKKGIYCYYWIFNPSRIKYLVTDLKKRNIDKLKDRLEREGKNDFFACSNKCIRLDFEQSINFQFKCPECGSLMDVTDNSDEIRKIEERIKQLEIELKR